MVKPRVVVPPAKAPKARAKRKPAAISHAAAVKVELLNAVADALGRAPVKYDPKSPKTTIAVNGSLYTIRNTVEALNEFQSRLEKLKTKVRVPGVPLSARSFPIYTPSNPS